MGKAVAGALAAGHSEGAYLLDLRLAAGLVLAALPEDQGLLEQVADVQVNAEAPGHAATTEETETAIAETQA